MPLFYKIGAVEHPRFVEATREDLVDSRSKQKTLLKTRQLLASAAGGVLFVDEAYTLLPSDARKNSLDHGAIALREISKSLPKGDPLVILAGYPADSELLMASDIGFRGNFLLKIEFPDLTPTQLAQVFFLKLHAKGLVPGDSMTVNYLSSLFERFTKEEWISDRNGYIADNLLNAVRFEIKKRRINELETNSIALGRSPIKLSPPGSNTISNFGPDDIIVTTEDVKNALERGL